MCPHAPVCTKEKLINKKVTCLSHVGTTRGHLLSVDGQTITVRSSGSIRWLSPNPIPYSIDRTYLLWRQCVMLRHDACSPRTSFRQNHKIIIYVINLSQINNNMHMNIKYSYTLTYINLCISFMHMNIVIF